MYWHSGRIESACIVLLAAVSTEKEGREEKYRLKQGFREAAVE